MTNTKNYPPIGTKRLINGNLWELSVKNGEPLWLKIEKSENEIDLVDQEISKTIDVKYKNNEDLLTLLERFRFKQQFEFRKRFRDALQSKKMRIVKCDFQQLLDNALISENAMGVSDSVFATGNLIKSNLWEKTMNPNSPIFKELQNWFGDDEILAKINFNTKTIQQENSEKLPEESAAVMKKRPQYFPDIFQKNGYRYIEKNGQNIEFLIYSTFISRIVDFNFAPGFPIPVDIYRCKGESFKSLPAKAAQMFADIQKNRSDIANVLLLEKIRGVTLNRWMKDQKHTPKSWHEILIQFFYLNMVLHQLGVIHGDPHTENYLVVPLTTSKKIFLFIDEKHYIELEIKYLLVCLDFDFASVMEHPTDSQLADYTMQCIQSFDFFIHDKIGKTVAGNVKAELEKFGMFPRKDKTSPMVYNSNGQAFAQSGIYSAWSPAGDLFVVLSHMLKNHVRYNLPKSIHTLLNNIFYNDYVGFRKKYAVKNEHFTICEVDNNTGCLGPANPDPKTEMMDEEMILKTLFKDYIKPIEEFSPLNKPKYQDVFHTPKVYLQYSKGQFDAPSGFLQMLNSIK